METFCPTTSFVVPPNSNCMMQQSNSTTEWTKEENNRFESALAIYDEMTPNRWSKVAALDVMMQQYKELVADVSDIDAGFLPNPRRFASSFRRFLMGLEKYGKGDWRNISRNFVISKTPTQVASHAQKYCLRQLSGEKERKRPSIYDITTTHLTNDELLVNNKNNNNNKSTCEVKSYMSPLQRSTSTTNVLIGCWNNSDDEEPSWHLVNLYDKF